MSQPFALNPSLVVTADPTVTSVAAAKGALLLYKPAVGASLVFQKQDDGDTTNWFQVGSIISSADPTKQTLLASNVTVANKTATFPDLTGTVLVSTPATPGVGGQVFINATGPTVGSNAGVQLNSDVANRGQFRGNQYGNNGGIAGITGFKSRGLTIGALAAVAAGDVLCRMTAIGVTGNNANIPNSAYLNLQVAAGGVFATWLASEFSVTLTSIGNVQSEKMKVSSEGRLSNIGARITHVRVVNGTDTLSADTDRKIIFNDNTASAFNLNLPVGVEGLMFEFGQANANTSTWTLVGTGGNTVDANAQAITTAVIGAIVFSGGVWYACA